MKKIVALFVQLFILAILSSGHAHAAGNPPERISGQNRFQVAADIAVQGWPNGANTLILANYLAFSDAMTAAPLAYKDQAPILLTRKDQLTDTTKNEIERLNPSKIIIVGGPGSVSGQVVQELKDMHFVNIERIGGSDRYKVAYNISRKFTSGTAVIADGLKFSDALTIGPYAARNGIPILLTRPNKLPTVTKQALKGKNKTLVIGGPASVTPSVYRQLTNPLRIGGKDRYDVAANIVQDLGMNPQGAFVATGLKFADALTGSALAAKENAPILLTRPDGLPDATKEIIRSKKIQNYVILGGPASVAQRTTSNLRDLLIPRSPVIYLVPHADDAVLSYAVDIRNQMANGRPVYTVLLSDGGDSGAREVLNGAWDSGVPVKCPIHHVYHNPIKEHYKDGYLTEEEFSHLRVQEYVRAMHALGIPDSHTFVDIVPLHEFTAKNIRPVIEKYLKKFPNAEFRTMSPLDAHPPHAEIGKALKSMENDGEISPFKTFYFVSIYTGRFKRKPIPYGKHREYLEHPSSGIYIDAAEAAFKKFDPSKGFYAIGYHSVPSQFDALAANLYNSYHY